MSFFSNKKALVTGATSGIGKCIAFKLLQEGVEVLFAGRNFEGLDNEISNLSLPTSKYHFLKADFLFENDLKCMIQDVFKITDYIDILVHSAGIIKLGRIEDSDVGQLDELFQVNVKAPYFITQNLLSILKKSDRGNIVFLNSTAGLDSWANISQYAASKHALTAITKSLREEVRFSGINIIGVYPGGTDTPMQKKIQQMEGNKYDASLFMAPEYVADLILHAIKVSGGSIVTDLIIKPITK